MSKFSKDVDISWNEGGPSLKTAISNLEDKLNALKVDINRPPEGKLDRILYGVRQSQEETKEFYIFWDEIFSQLAYKAKEASVKFANSLKPELKKQVKIIAKEYPTDDWDKIVKDTIDSIGDLVEDGNDDDED